MAWSRFVLIGGSLLAHGVLVVALGGIKGAAAPAATSIDVMETTKKEAPPPPADIEPPPPPKEEAPRRVPNTKAAAAPPPEPAPAPATPNLAALPDLGLELSGGTGPALATNAPAHEAGPTPKAPIEKTLAKAPPPKADTCEEPPAKPKLKNLPQPAYTDAARAAGIEGKVRVALTVDENGKVADVKVLSSLGHGLDEAAIAAAKAASFEPAMRCGRASRSTFTIAIRFAAS